MKGIKIIALEGPDNTGKTTQALMLAKALNAEYLKFPNEKIYSGQILRKILNKELPFEPASFQALQILNRLETYRTLIPGKTYVCDRNKLSGTVYGRADNLPVIWLRDALDFIPDADITFLFVGQSYRQDSDIYGDPEYQEKIIKLYSEEAKNSSGKLFWIHTEGTKEDIHKRILFFLEGEL